MTFFRTYSASTVALQGSSDTVFWNVQMYTGTIDDSIVNHDLFLCILIYII